LFDVFDWCPISKDSMTSWLVAPKQWRQCFGRSLVRQCHAYLLTYYPTGTRVPDKLPGWVRS